jgi:hypothetical protein
MLSQNSSALIEKNQAVLLHFVLLVQTFLYAITMCQVGPLIFLEMPQTYG